MDKEQIMQIVSNAIEETFMTKSNEISRDTVVVPLKTIAALSGWQ